MKHYEELTIPSTGTPLYRIMTDSLDELLAIGKQAKRLGQWTSASGMSSRDVKEADPWNGDDMPWNGTRTWSEAVELAERGWPEGLKRLSDIREEVMDAVGRALPEPAPFMDVAGFEVDVGAYVSGEPEHMLTWADQDRDKGMVHIVFNVCANAMTSPAQMLLRGAMVAALVDAYEHVGKRVRLTVYAGTRGWGGGHSTVGCTIKTESEVLDLERVAFATAHPAMLRRIEFAVLESLPPEARSKLGIPGGYGSTSEDRDLHLRPDEQGDIYVGSQDSFRDATEVLDSVMKHLRESGVVE